MTYRMTMSPEEEQTTRPKSLARYPLCNHAVAHQQSIRHSDSILLLAQRFFSTLPQFCCLHSQRFFRLRKTFAPPRNRTPSALAGGIRQQNERCHNCLLSDRTHSLVCKLAGAGQRSSKASVVTSYLPFAAFWSPRGDEWCGSSQRTSALTGQVVMDNLRPCLHRLLDVWRPHQTLGNGVIVWDKTLSVWRGWHQHSGCLEADGNIATVSDKTLSVWRGSQQHSGTVAVSKLMTT